MSLLSRYRHTMILLAALAGLGQVTSACAVALVGGGAAAGAVVAQDRGAKGVLSDTRIRSMPRASKAAHRIATPPGKTGRRSSESPCSASSST